MSPKVAEADSDEEEQDVLQFKLVILGDGAVGKTSLSMRFSEDRFAKRYTEILRLGPLDERDKVRIYLQLQTNNRGGFLFEATDTAWQ